MLTSPIVILSVLAYIFAARFSLGLTNRKLGSVFFAIANIAGFVWLSLLSRFDEWSPHPILSLGTSAVVRHISLIAFYVSLMAIGYVLLRKLAAGDAFRPWIAFLYPIGLLVVFRYTYILWDPLLDRLEWGNWVVSATIVGLSYMAFRLSYLVLEVRNGVARMPTLSEYLGFAFFLPTILVGPINTYSTHRRSIQYPQELEFPPAQCLFRIVVGATKFLFLANIANQLTYAGLFFDGKPHSLIDLPIAVIFYYLFLYLNFSGICDMAIGVAGLVGVRVKENFDNPFAARNVQDFWNRWHITLSSYARDVIFAPLSKGLIRKLGVGHTNLSIAASALVVFLVIGIWHGVGWGFAAFGLIHAIGVIANHYYTIWLKRTLSKERYRKYNESRLIRAVATSATFIYVAASFFVFANSRDMMGLIARALLDGLQV